MCRRSVAESLDASASGGVFLVLRIDFEERSAEVEDGVFEFAVATKMLESRAALRLRVASAEPNCSNSE